MSTVIAAALSDVGRVRDHNEDSYCLDLDEKIFLVADGMGGHAAGEVASKMAVDGVLERWSSAALRAKVQDYATHGDIERRRTLLRALRGTVLEAHQGIVERSRTEDDKKGMGTTLTGFLIAGGEALFAHAGDSRAYLVRDRIPVLLSEDHTVTQSLRAAGIDRGVDEVTPERWKGVLTNALGIGEDTQVATFVVPLYAADTLLLCSDGIHEYFSEVEIGKIVSEQVKPESIAQRLVELALERGGADNATVVVVQVTEAKDTHVSTEVRAHDEQAVASCPLFDGLSPQEILRTLRITIPRFYAKGKDVPRVALEDRVAYIVLDGEIAGSGVEAKTGDIVLAAALVQKDIYSEASLRAESDTRLLMIRRNDFAELCEDDVELSVKLYEALGKLV